jgi:hypothetical protein
MRPWGIQRFSPSGAFLAKWAPFRMGGLSDPGGQLATDNRGSLYIVEQHTDVIQRFGLLPGAS